MKEAIAAGDNVKKMDLHPYITSERENVSPKEYAIIRAVMVWTIDSPHQISFKMAGYPARTICDIYLHCLVT